MAHVDLGAGVGWLAGTGIGDIAGWDIDADRAKRAPVTLAATLATVGAVATLEALGAPRPDASVTAVSLAHGTWIGAWSPFLFTSKPKENEITGGLRLGLGGGYVLSRFIAPFGPADARSLGLQAAGFTAGAALGAGIPLAVGVEPQEDLVQRRTVIVPMLIGGALGHIGGAAIAPHYNLSDNDAALLSVLGAWTAYQAAGWSAYSSIESEDTSQHLGNVLTAAGGGTALALGMAPVIELEPAESLLAASFGGWGTWYAAWGGYLMGFDSRETWALTLTAGNVALLGSAALMAGPVRADWGDLAYIDGLGLIGAASGAMIGLVASPDDEPVATLGLIGSTVGLGAGLYFAARKPGGNNPIGALSVADLGIDIPGEAKVAVRPWVDEAGDPGVWVDLSVTDW